MLWGWLRVYRLKFTVSGASRLRVRGCRVSILGGSWLVISRVISRVTILITLLRGLATPLITTHEPPSRPQLDIQILRRGALRGLQVVSDSTSMEAKIID